jgi:hypothetical protein
VQTLLANVRASQVLTEPFPHVIVENLLPEDLYLRLASEYPSLEVITRDAALASNQRFSVSAVQALSDDRISSLWREFVRLHTSQVFFAQVIELFGQHIRAIYPSFEKNIGQLGELSSSVRYDDSRDGANVLLDAQICVNTSVVETPSAVRRVHVDSPNKLFTGLYYFRHPDDTSAGGDLELYRFKKRPHGFKMAEIDDRYVEVVKTIKYQRNTLVVFINNIRALHGVTERALTPFPRYLFNLVGEVKHPLFDLEQYQKSKVRGYLLKSLRGARRVLRLKR